MCRAVVDVRLVRLVQLFHLRFRRRDRVTDAGILLQAAVESEHRGFDIPQPGG